METTAVLWGVKVVGITQTKFLLFLLILTLYYAVRFVYVVIRIHILCNFVASFKEMFHQGHNLGWYDSGKHTLPIMGSMSKTDVLMIVILTWELWNIS